MDLEPYLSVARQARHCVVLTGAGVSAESGVPTFRGAQGLWRSFKPEKWATPEAFMRNPEAVLEWYQWRRTQLETVQPNEGHRALAAATGLFERFTLITQNVDGLHQRAGSRDVIELHGSIVRDRCHRCGRDREGEGLRCRCGGPYRPAVVWFGEALPMRELQLAFEAVGSADLVVTAGTSGQVYPAAQLPFEAARSGAFTVEVNLERTPFTPYADLALTGPSGEWLPRLFDTGRTEGSARSVNRDTPE